MISEKFNELYGDYYTGSNFSKREITAIQTMNHISQLYKGEKLKKVLDVGAGEGSLLQQMSRNRFSEELYAVEISESGISSIKNKNISNLVQISTFDGYKIPYPDNFFDLATCIHVLEHVEHERLFLTELKRVANNLIIEVPLENTVRIDEAIEIGKIYGHINFYTPKTFANLLVTSGIDINNLQIFSNDKELECFIGGKLKGMLKYYFKKTALQTMPNLSTRRMTYLCMAYCNL